MIKERVYDCQMSYSSHDSDILAALQRGDVLTPAIAHERWGVLALHSAIARLRKRGHNIPCKMVNGHGEYKLVSAPQEQPVNSPIGRKKPTEQDTDPRGVIGREVPAVAEPIPYEQLNSILGAPTSQKWPLEPMQGETAIHHPAPECKGVIAARERLEPEGSLNMVKDSSEARRADSHAKLAGAQNDVTGRRDGQPYEQMVSHDIYDKNGKFKYTLRYIAVGFAK